MWARGLTAALLVSVGLCEVLEVPLDGEWTMSGGPHHNVRAVVPGQVMTSLYHEGIIPDPTSRDLFKTLPANISSLEWTYRREFSVPHRALDLKSAVLVMDGIQTFATVSVNGAVVARPHNMFRRWIVPISSLKADGNVIEIALSPLWGANRTLTRMEQSSFGWDWAAEFLPQGIWRSVRVFFFDHILITDVVPIILGEREGGTDFTVDVNVFVLSSGEGEVSFEVRGEWGNNGYFRAQVPAGESNHTVHLTARDVALWWPNGYGRQHLYRMEVRGLVGDEVVAETERRVGFRTIKHENLHKGLTHTQTFYVNGVPVYIKGANWVPPDAFEVNVTPELARRILEGAARVHMNLLRIWGGGVYAHDWVYAIADELGIMLWQEGMFACAVYPHDADFLANVDAEIRYQARRLATHPSVAIYCSNNEITPRMLWFIPEWWYTLEGWNELFLHTVLRGVAEEDWSRSIWPFSPSDGWRSGVDSFGRPDGSPLMYEDGYWPFPNETSAVHYYEGLCPNNKCQQCDNPWRYPNASFASEYGWAGMPSWGVIHPVTEPQDWGLLTPVMVARQNTGMINSQLAAMVELFFPAPNLTAVGEAPFRRALYLSQLQQSFCLRAETEHYRRGRDKPEHTMGSMYWMLADQWQAPSWGSIEHEGRWRMFHSFAQSFYSPVHASLAVPLEGEADNIVTAHIANDGPDPLRVDAYVGVVHYANGEARLPFPSVQHTMSLCCRDAHPTQIFQKPFTVDVPARAGVFFHNASIPSLLKDANCPSASHCFLIVGLSEEPYPLRGAHAYRLASLKEADASEVTVRATVADVFHDRAIVTVSAESVGVALWVTLENDGLSLRFVVEKNVLTHTVAGFFEENAFLLWVGRPANVSFSAFGPIDESLFKSTLHVQTLNSVGWRG